MTAFQPNLFDVVEKRCGTCVVRNSVSEDAATGACAVHNAPRAWDHPACAWWFGLHQLRSPAYGRGASR